jgi:hypothetical protein
MQAGKIIMYCNVYSSTENTDELYKFTTFRIGGQMVPKDIFLDL